MKKISSFLFGTLLALLLMGAPALAASPSDYTCPTCDEPCTAWFPTNDSGKAAHMPLCEACNSAVWDKLEHCTLAEGTATCMAPDLCSVCGIPAYASGLLPDPDAHSYGDWEPYSGTQHFKRCTICGNSDSYKYEDHYGGTATCTEQAICDVCGWEYGDIPGHAWGEWVQSGEQFAWQHTRTCRRDAEHTETDYCSGGTATCTEKARCSVCAAEYGELAAHTYENDNCIVCGAADPAYVPDLPETGDSSRPLLWLAMGVLSTLSVLLLKKKEYGR